MGPEYLLFLLNPPALSTKPLDLMVDGIGNSLFEVWGVCCDVLNAIKLLGDRRLIIKADRDDENIVNKSFL